jgi:putative membrane protein
MRVFATILLIVSVSVGVAVAQPRSAAPGEAGIGNPAGAPPDMMQITPGGPVPHRPNLADRGFAHMAAMGGQAEVALGRLAEQRSQTPPVRAFGEHMVADHTRANARLAALAQADRIVLPSELDQSYRDGLARLEQAQGREFDLSYIRGQIIGHQLMAQLFAYEVGSGQDPELKAFASQTLPVVLEHLRMAQQVYAELSGAGLPEAAAAGTGR